MTIVSTTGQCTWDTRTNMHAFGAQLESGLTTVAACMAFCSQTPTCVAFDFRRSNSGCYPHFDPNDLNRVAADADLDYYIKVTCSRTFHCLRLSGRVVSTTPGFQIHDVVASVHVHHVSLGNCADTRQFSYETVSRQE